MKKPTTCQQYEPLLSARIDGELTQQQQQKVDLHVVRCIECQKALQELKRVRQGIADLETPQPTPEQWRRLIRITVTGTSRGMGWLAAIGGGLVLTGYVLYEFLTDTTEAAWVKVSVVASLLGFALLLISVWLERLRARKSDRYKDVEL